MRSAGVPGSDPARADAARDRACSRARPARDPSKRARRSHGRIVPRRLARRRGIERGHSRVQRHCSSPAQARSSRNLVRRRVHELPAGGRDSRFQTRRSSDVRKRLRELRSAGEGDSRLYETLLEKGEQLRILGNSRDAERRASPSGGRGEARAASSGPERHAGRPAGTSHRGRGRRGGRGVGHSNAVEQGDRGRATAPARRSRPGVDVQAPKARPDRDAAGTQRARRRRRSASFAQTWSSWFGTRIAESSW